MRRSSLSSGVPASAPPHPPSRSGAIVRLSCLETLRRVTRDGMSVARFGDGECRMAFSQKDIAFQRWSRRLQDGLLRVLVEPKPGVLPTFNHYYRDHALIDWIAAFERYPKHYVFRRTRRVPDDIGVLWRLRDMLMYRRYWSLVRRVTHVPAFGDTSMFYLGCYLDHYARGAMDEVIAEFRRLFDGRRILFVAPEAPMGGASFRSEADRLKAIGLVEAEFLTIPATDSLEQYDDILAAIRAKKWRGDIFLQAGPAATVAAWELAGETDGRVIDAGSLNTQLRYLAD